jgi:hypothetical protein
MVYIPCKFNLKRGPSCLCTKKECLEADNLPLPLHKHQRETCQQELNHNSIAHTSGDFEANYILYLLTRTSTQSPFANSPIYTPGKAGVPPASYHSSLRAAPRTEMASDARKTIILNMTRKISRSTQYHLDAIMTCKPRVRCL